MFCKKFELMIAIMENQLVKFLEDNNPMDNDSHGFRTGHSDWSILIYIDADSCKINSDSKIP